MSVEADVSIGNTLPVADLLEMGASYNPRKIDPKDLAALRASIRTFGAVEPVVVNTRTNTIVGGHQRVKAAGDEGIDEFPVVYVDLDEDGERQLNLALNRISGTWDDEKLRAVLLELESHGADMALTGFDDKELSRLLQEIADGETDADAVPGDADVQQRAETGEIWTLGNHRLLVGDITEPGAIDRLYGDKTPPVLCMTDPPYGVEYDPNWRNVAHEEGKLQGGATRIKTVENDDRADWSEVWSACGCDVIYAWCSAVDPMIDAGHALISSGYEIRASLIWRKTNFPISRGHYTFTHEPCWYAVKKGATAHWIGDNNASTVWEVGQDKSVPGGHSTQKPVELFTRSIGNHQGDVFEPFLGSGTCMIACEQLSRACFASEVNPHYADVAIQRWENFTGEKAEVCDAD